jgi:hypothetical protein
MALKDSQMHKRVRPSVSRGIDTTNKLHVWLRTDARLITYDDRQSANHEGLNQLVKDIGGRHMDVVIGNGKNVYQYRLEFCLADYRWLEVPNGDGTLVDGYGEEYEPGKGQVLQYIGHVKDGRETLESIARIGE